MRWATPTSQIRVVAVGMGSKSNQNYRHQMQMTARECGDLEQGDRMVINDTSLTHICPPPQDMRLQGVHVAGGVPMSGKRLDEVEVDE